MELYGKNVLTGVFQTLVGFVIDIFKGSCRYSRIQAIHIYGIAVVLGGNIDSSGLQILYRVIAASVAVFQLVGCLLYTSSSRQAHPITTLDLAVKMKS